MGWIGLIRRAKYVLAILAGGSLRKATVGDVNDDEHHELLDLMGFICGGFIHDSYIVLADHIRTTHELAAQLLEISAMPRRLRPPT